MRNALTVYTNVIHTSTYGIQALKLTRPSTEPSARIGVIAANTNWKCTSEDCGKWKSGPVVSEGITDCPGSAACPRTLAGLPRAVPRKPFAPKIPEPLCAMDSPKPILKAHSTHATSTRQKATNVSIMLLTDQ